MANEKDMLDPKEITNWALELHFLVDGIPTTTIKGYISGAILRKKDEDWGIDRQLSIVMAGLHMEGKNVVFPGTSLVKSVKGVLVIRKCFI